MDRIEGIEIGAAIEVPCEEAQTRVLAIGKDVDPINQTVLIRGAIENIGGCLRPGQFIEARLQLADPETRFRLPSSALVRSDKTTLIFVHAPFGFLATQVRVVAEQDGYTVVTGALTGDESVAVSGIASIKASWMGLGGGE